MILEFETERDKMPPRFAGVPEGRGDAEKEGRMKKDIRAGQERMGMFLSEIAAPNLLRLMKASGVDYVIVDCEHGYFDYSQVAALAAVGSGIGFPVIVRVAALTREPVQKYLDAGVDGLLVPMLETREQAEALVMYGKYAPEGKRGISTMRPHSNYNPGKLTEYTAAANERIILLAQIETKRGVENIEEIVRVPGIDGVLVGPNDLACDLGKMGDFSTPEIKDCIDRVIRAAAGAGIPSGIITSKVGLIKECRQKGMTLFSCDSELGLLKKGITAMLEATRA